MQIIIVGCGKVGRTLAEQLQEEESDITLIDVSSNVINSLEDDIDAMGIVGNGASINTLMEAGIENADILIAVTGSDEMNLLCCLIAQKQDTVTPSPVSVIRSMPMKLASSRSVLALP